MAAIHALSFPPDERWSKAGFAAQLALGAAGWIDRHGLILMRRVGEEAEILTLAVVPAARRQGVGRQLLRTAMTHGWAQGVTRLFLEVSTANGAARALYAAAGFVEAGVRPRYYPDGADALLLVAGPRRGGDAGSPA